MRKPFIALLILLFFTASVPSAVAKDAGAVRFSGSYDWTDGGSDDLTAEFKPVGEGSWKVKFSFRFSGKKNSWKGSATGSLEEGGKLTGTSGWNGRTWEFEASIEDGVLKGTHTEIKAGDTRYHTGTFEMRR